MVAYAYSFDIEIEGGQLLAVFRRFPNVFCNPGPSTSNALANSEYRQKIVEHLIAALQAVIVNRLPLPIPDDPNLVDANGAVELSVQQSMKLELYKVYLTNCSGIRGFAAKISKTETSARRLLDLHHPSKASELEFALREFGKVYCHVWETKTANPNLISSGIPK